MSSGKLEVLSTDECLTLLDQAKVGRVGVSTGASPEIFPVVYKLLEGAIVFRTAEGTKLHAAARNTVLAFEVDDFDSRVSEGWSVLVVGRSDEVTDRTRINVDRVLLPDSWVTADRYHVVSIALDRVTGRRITERE
jgi:nitroimidazol reductase NimA-like FMN-containing flavoprotein (pyridoxamine 5'-phosphate oxidase superfamily)